MIEQGILNGLMSGWVYILVALGLTLVLSVAGIIQLAHGEIYTLGAYAMYYIFVVMGVNFILAVFLSALLLGLCGIVLERFFFRPFRQQPDRAVIIALGLVLLLQNTTIVTFGAEHKALPSPFTGVLNFFGVTLSVERLVIIIISIVLVVALFIFIQKTKAGQAMVAISQDLEAASLQGININRVSSITVAIGCFLAAAAGALIGSIFTLVPTMGDFALMKGIAVIILGGLGSIGGSIIGGLILGLVDGIVPVFSTIHVANIFGFVVIIFVLILRPQGIMGHESQKMS